MKPSNGPAPPAGPLPEAQLFVVRVWRQAEAFRASVRAVGDEEPRWFDAPAGVACFLAATVGLPPPSPCNEGDPDDPLA